MEWVYLLALAQEGASVGCDFRSGKLLVLIFCGLGNAVKTMWCSPSCAPKEVYIGQNGDF
jgi:hypothetical protein